jgi:ribose-phosphate pyrophosphokinase
MITLNGTPVEIGSFPDGTILMKQGDDQSYSAEIEWHFENDREFLALIYLVKHLRHCGYGVINLVMPYIPNARQDRAKNPEDVFTLKYFAELLNSLKLNSVEVLDPHSSVSEALIDNLFVRTPKKYINEVLTKLAPISYRYINYDSGPIPKEEYSLTMFYPDEGAMKRYSGMVNLPYAFGIKKRNWETGKIEGLDVAGAVDKIAGHDILIVDDICSKGGTFLHSARKLKELGANDIYLYVSHCENTILEGNLLAYDGLIKKVFTTDSIFTKSHEKIEVLK